jgi:predicted transcriptional regulator/ribosomal protein S18 acetylase RimI-like enzyme
VETSHLYPGIDLWWRRKVLPDVEAGRRVVVVLRGDQSLGGVLIGKPGRRAKLCTLRVRKELRARGFGMLLLAEGVNHLVGNNTEEVYVTVSEAADLGCTSFFETMGFRMVASERNRYLRGVDELVYSCPAQSLRAELQEIAIQRGVRTLFGLMPNRAEQEARARTLLFSLRPHFAELMMRGKKSVEFRRRFSLRHTGAKVFFYVSSPVQSLMLSARISHVEEAPTMDLWATHKNEGAISRESFCEYFEGARTGFAISLKNLRALQSPLPLNRLKAAWPAFCPPQAFSIIDPETSLAQMLSAGCMEGDGNNGHRHSLGERGPRS